MVQQGWQPIRVGMVHKPDRRDDTADQELEPVAKFKVSSGSAALRTIAGAMGGGGIVMIFPYP